MCQRRGAIELGARGLGHDDPRAANMNQHQFALERPTIGNVATELLGMPVIFATG